MIKINIKKYYFRVRNPLNFFYDEHASRPPSSLCIQLPHQYIVKEMYILEIQIYVNVIKIYTKISQIAPKFWILALSTKLIMVKVISSH